MNLPEFKKLLDTAGYPVAYEYTKEQPEKPYIIYYEAGRSNVYADDMVYAHTTMVTVELYTEYKSPNTEKKLEEIFIENELIYKFRNIGKIDAEGVYCVEYDIEL